jgi:hypothetical protein
LQKITWNLTELAVKFPITHIQRLFFNDRSLADLKDLSDEGAPTINLNKISVLEDKVEIVDVQYEGEALWVTTYNYNSKRS